MLITESFNSQLDDLLERICVKLQISSTQHQLAKNRYEAISNWLEAEGSPLVAVRPTIYPQGSLRIGTTAKPLAQQEYDLDLVCEMQVDWRRLTNPLILLDAVEDRLRDHQIYKTMLERKNRCIRVNYANEFHLDILPACPDFTSRNGCLVVPDCEAREWKPSNPKGYASWFESQAERVMLLEKAEPLPKQEPVEQKAPLKRVVQLLKRWRDIAYAKNLSTAPISIVLTTLAGQHYGYQESVNGALTGVLNSIVASLPTNGQRLVVLNPKNRKEDLSELWDENPEAYNLFVSGVVAFGRQWEELNRQRGIHQVTATLERLFGENLAKSVVAEQAQFIEKSRSAQKLGIQRNSGILGSVTSSGTIPIRPNTFHGK